MSVKLEGSVLCFSSIDIDISTDTPKVCRVEIFDPINKFKIEETVLRIILSDAKIDDSRSFIELLKLRRIWRKCEYSQAVPLVSFQDRFSVEFSFVPYSVDICELISYIFDEQSDSEFDLRKLQKLLFLPDVIETLHYFCLIPEYLYTIISNDSYEIFLKNGNIILSCTEVPLIDRNNSPRPSYYFLSTYKIKIFFLIPRFRKKLFEALDFKLVNPSTQSLICQMCKPSDIIGILL